MKRTKKNVSQVDPKSPDLHSVHKSCETSLNLNFAVLNVILHQEGLLSIISFVSSIQEEITSMMETQQIDKVASAGRRLSTVSASKIQAVTAKGKFNLLQLQWIFIIYSKEHICLTLRIIV